MHNTLKNWKQTFTGFAPDSELTCGIVFVIVLSCVFSFIPYYFDLSDHFFSLESSAVISGHGKSCLPFIYYKFTIHVYNECVNHVMFGRHTLNTSK